MGALILPGEFMNALTRSISVTANEADADFPVSNVFANEPAKVWRGASATPTTSTVSVVNNLLANGLLNDWSGGLPISWTHNGTGTVQQENTIKTEGASSARLNTTGCAIYGLVPVRASERLRITGDMRALAGGDRGDVQIASLRTGLHLRTDGTWGAQQNLLSSTSTTFEEKTFDFSVQTVAELSGPGDILAVWLQAGLDGAYFDDWWIVPEIDFVSLHGHNFGSYLTSEAGAGVNAINLFSGDAAPASTNRASWIRAGGEIASPTFYKQLASPIFAKHWQLAMIKAQGLDASLFPFAQLQPVELGEFVLGRTIQLIQNPSYGVELIEDWPQERQEVEGVTVQTFNLSRHPRRRVVLPFNTTTPTYEQVRDFLFRATRGGQDPVVVVPDDQRPEVVFGHITRGFEPSAVTFDRWGYDIVIEESPFAVPLS